MQYFAFFPQFQDISPCQLCSHRTAIVLGQISAVTHAVLLLMWISSQQLGGNVPSCLDKNIKWLGNKELGKAVDKVHA